MLTTMLSVTVWLSASALVMGLILLLFFIPIYSRLNKFLNVIEGGEKSTPAAAAANFGEELDGATVAAITAAVLSVCESERAANPERSGAKVDFVVRSIRPRGR